MYLFSLAPGMDAHGAAPEVRHFYSLRPSIERQAPLGAASLGEREAHATPTELAARERPAAIDMSRLRCLVHCRTPSNNAKQRRKKSGG
jgi:hypothetical protein